MNDVHSHFQLRPILRLPERNGQLGLLFWWHRSSHLLPVLGMSASTAGCTSLYAGESPPIHPPGMRSVDRSSLGVGGILEHFD